MSSEFSLLAAATPSTPPQDTPGPSQADEPAPRDLSHSSAPLNTSSSTSQTLEATRKPSQPLRSKDTPLDGHEQSPSSPHGPSRGKRGRKVPIRQPQYTQEDWDSMKDAIRDLYIVQSRPLDAVVQHMTQAYGFNASHNMYKKQLREWMMYKNESSRQAYTRVDVSTERLAKRHRTIMAHPRRPESCDMRPAFLWQERKISGWLDPEMKALGCLITKATTYIDALFDQGRKEDPVAGWKGDSFDLIAPRGRKDHSLEWKVVADQCHGASSLVQRDTETQNKCRRTLSNIFADIDTLAQYDDPWMIVYIWRIILYLRGISYRIEHRKVGIPSERLTPQNDHLVGYTISRFASRMHPECYMVACLNSLRTFSLDKMKLAIERVFKACIDLFSKYLGGCHPVVLKMTARFLRYWPARLEGHVLPNYEILMARSETELEPSDERTISFLTEYMYIAHYQARDKALTQRLAKKILLRTHEAEPVPVPQWGQVTYGRVLASKLLSKIDKDSGKVDDWKARLDFLAARLRNGDRECQTRALQIRRMMANWYREAGNDEKASEETACADEIFKCMREAVVRQEGWD
ncbi:hypothetical protein LX32DRAFT_645598 [Colletotrichum zoysiae]|uniref:Clr5 domain-containing protein n=1 Tax=Colletotrichum zoysiae TaxID=1216348 RepID=A0AAD9LY14_9PEZI|nr:hypothetical protein LX32DRAFT_645598 [Colletotrichum zoysiae]